MKKIFTLLLVAIAVGGAAKAQTTEDARRVILGQKKENTKRSEDGDVTGNRRDDRRYEEDRRYSGSREAEIDRVNREYDYKIQSVRNNNALSTAEKERIIRDLNKDRDKEITRINKAYKERNDRDDDRDDDDRKHKKDKKYKSNNGKHKGWEKGKGNKHRDRDDD